MVDSLLGGNYLAVDVYKRQVQGCADGMAQLAAAGDREEMLQDVYKRQIYIPTSVKRLHLKISIPILTKIKVFIIFKNRIKT